MKPVGPIRQGRLALCLERPFYRWRTGPRADDFVLQQGSGRPVFSRDEGFGKAGHPIGTFLPAAGFFESLDPLEPFHNASFFYVFIRLSKTRVA